MTRGQAVVVMTCDGDGGSCPVTYRGGWSFQDNALRALSAGWSRVPGRDGRTSDLCPIHSTPDRDLEESVR